MSGGSYNYLYYKAEEGATELLESREDLEAMLQRLRELEYASEVAKETENVLGELDGLRQLQAESELKLAPLQAKIQAKSRNLAPIWHAVEWWDSRDWSEEEVKKAIAEFQTDSTSDHLLG